MLFSSSVEKEIQETFNLLRENKENKENCAALLASRKQALLSEFMAMNLKTKFQRIKFNCSLKFYAKNVPDLLYSFSKNR